MSDIIQPRVLKGFRDLLPKTEIARQNIVRILEREFFSHGFVPIDTPALEYAELLLSKGGGETDKQCYRFTDHGGRDVALRFDLTVPFARFIAAHHHELPLPFKRFHIAKVWRGENPQRGRYREFYQCDFDIIGTGAPSADLEILLMVHSVMRALNIKDTVLRFSHRGLFNALLKRLGRENQDAAVLRAVDKSRKIGLDGVKELLADLVGAEDGAIILDFIEADGENRRRLEKMTALAYETGPAGTDKMLRDPQTPPGRVAGILDALEELKLGGLVILDPSITRGLDYYTGMVFEVFMKDLPGLGSLCSGGRYDRLSGLYSKKPLPGAGGSLGLDRLMAGLEELERLNDESSGADILVMHLEEGLIAHYHSLAMRARDHGLRAEVYPDKKKLAVQFKYAELRNIPLALLVGADERSGGTVTLKDLAARQNHENISLNEAFAKADDILRRT